MCCLRACQRVRYLKHCDGLIKLEKCMQDGQLRVFLAALPALAAAHGACVARLTALREVSITRILGGSSDDDSNGGRQPSRGAQDARANGLLRRSSSAAGAGNRLSHEAGPNGGSGSSVGFRELAVVQLPAEPTLLALGPRHLATAARQKVKPCAGFGASHFVVTLCTTSCIHVITLSHFTPSQALVTPTLTKQCRDGCQGGADLVL